MHQLLVIEDDKTLGTHLLRGLSEQGYQCELATTLKTACERLNQHQPDLILLDLGLPDGDGFSLLETLRQAQNPVPIIITSARNDITDRVTGLDLGANDYLIKPYAFEELMARIRTQLRHLELRGRTRYVIGPLRLNLTTHQVTLEEHVLDLTPREFDLLAYLASLKGDVASRQMLQEEVWKIKSAMSSMDNVIDVHISRVRQKLSEHSTMPLLHTVRAVGFRLGVQK